MEKNVRCNNCNKIIAQGEVTGGKIIIECRHCGVRNEVVPPRDEPAARVITMNIERRKVDIR